MSDKPIHVKPAFYAFCYEELKKIAHLAGYNLVLHGSMNRDLDLIAIPWVNEPLDEFRMIQELGMAISGFYSDQKEHYQFSILPGGRHAYVININRGGAWNHYQDGQWYIDISVTPTPVYDQH